MKHQKHKATQILIVGMFISFFFLLTGCASTCHKKRQIHSVVKSELQLLKSIQTERSDKAFVAKVSKDKTLFESEKRLQRALEAMIKASEQLNVSLAKKGERK